MSVIEWTQQGTPSGPLLLNSDHVASVRPLRTVLPSPNSQSPFVETQERGAEIKMADGTRHNVLESYDAVKAWLAPGGMPADFAAALKNVDGLQVVPGTPEHKTADAFPPTDEDGVVEETPKPAAKKAAPRKAPAKPEEKAETDPSESAAGIGD